MKTQTALMLAATIGVAASGCTSMTDLSSERVLDIQSTRVAAYIPAGTGQSSVSTYSSPTHAELSSERILAIQSTKVAAYLPTATSQSSAPARATSTRAALTRAAAIRAASIRAASIRSSKTASSKSWSAKSTPRKSSSAKASIKTLVSRHARAHGVPVKLALAVVQVESNFNPRARGQAGEVGLMQIKPATARGIGYKGSIKALYNPSTNLIWGMKYLAEARRRGGGSVCGTVLKYNGGHYAKRMNETSSRYCGKIKLIMRKTA